MGNNNALILLPHHFSPLLYRFLIFLLDLFISLPLHCTSRSIRVCMSVCESSTCSALWHFVNIQILVHVIVRVHSIIIIHSFMSHFSSTKQKQVYCISVIGAMCVLIIGLVSSLLVFLDVTWFLQFVVASL